MYKKFFSKKTYIIAEIGGNFKNFKEAKKVGAEFIISSFLINNKNLKLACPECNYSNELFLYRIL